MKLICFPHLGGFSMYYSFLRKHEYRNIDKILAFDYPRSSVSFDGTSDDFKCYVNAAVDFIKENLEPNEEYVLFGHSMGALVACEAGIEMQNTYGTAPAGVIVSGQNPPYSLRYLDQVKPPEDPIAFAMQLGGVPQKILDRPDMCKKLYRYAEKDIEALCHYKPTRTEGDHRLRCGMLLYGDQDVIVHPKLRRYWNQTFKSMYSEHQFSGDHFYFNQCPDQLAELLDDFAGAMTKTVV